MVVLLELGLALPGERPGDGGVPEVDGGRPDERPRAQLVPGPPPDLLDAGHFHQLVLRLVVLLRRGEAQGAHERDEVADEDGRCLGRDRGVADLHGRHAARPHGRVDPLAMVVGPAGRPRGPADPATGGHQQPPAWWRREAAYWRSPSGTITDRTKSPSGSPTMRCCQRALAALTRIAVVSPWVIACRSTRTAPTAARSSSSSTVASGDSSGICTSTSARSAGVDGGSGGTSTGLASSSFRSGSSSQSASGMTSPSVTVTTLALACRWRPRWPAGRRPTLPTRPWSTTRRDCWRRSAESRR